MVYMVVVYYVIPEGVGGRWGWLGMYNVINRYVARIYPSLDRPNYGLAYKGHLVDMALSSGRPIYLIRVLV